MSLKARVDADHNTLTNVVSIVGETRGEMHQRFDQMDKHLKQQDNEITELKEHMVKHDERFDKVEETLAIIVNHLKK